MRYALECWTGLKRAATRAGYAVTLPRQATHELLTSTLEHVLRTAQVSTTEHRGGSRG